MKKVNKISVIRAVFMIGAISVISIAIQSCKTHEKCPAYSKVNSLSSKQQTV